MASVALYSICEKHRTNEDNQSSQVKTLFFDRADCVDEAEKWKVDSAGVTENRFARLSLDAPRRYHVMMLPIAEETNVGYIVDVMPFLKIASQQAPTRNARASGRPPSDINGSN